MDLNGGYLDDFEPASGEEEGGASLDESLSIPEESFEIGGTDYSESFREDNGLLSEPEQELDPESKPEQEREAEPEEAEEAESEAGQPLASETEHEEDQPEKEHEQFEDEHEQPEDEHEQPEDEQERPEEAEEEPGKAEEKGQEEADLSLSEDGFSADALSYVELSLWCTP